MKKNGKNEKQNGTPEVKKNRTLSEQCEKCSSVMPPLCGYYYYRRVNTAVSNPKNNCDQFTPRDDDGIGVEPTVEISGEPSAQRIRHLLEKRLMKEYGLTNADILKEIVENRAIEALDEMLHRRNEPPNESWGAKCDDRGRALRAYDLLLHINSMNRQTYVLLIRTCDELDGIIKSAIAEISRGGVQ